MFIVKTKKQILGVALMMFLGVSAGALIRFSPIMGAFATDKDVKTVIIDAGHGLPDGGTVGYNGTIEHEINLRIAEKTEEVLRGKGFMTVMTRRGEESLAVDEKSSIREMKKNDMKIRKELIKKSDADIFISIHMNSYPNKNVSGLRLFYSANHEEISGLAEDIQSKIGEITGARTYAVKTADKDLFLMKNPPIPAILVECGFLSNPEEEKKLSEEEYQSKIAWAIAEAVEEYYFPKD